jgi:hypothetical protein
MGTTLQMQWLWFARTNPQRTWSGFKFGNEAQAESFFCRLRLGRGERWSEGFILVGESDLGKLHQVDRPQPLGSGISEGLAHSLGAGWYLGSGLGT